MPTPIEDITFLARTARGLKGVSGGDITLPSSTTAEGLDKAGDITIDAHGVGTTSVEAGNSGGGSFAFHVLGALNTETITVNGNATLKGSTTAIGLTVKYNAVGGQGFTFDGTPTAARTITIPDANGTVVLQDGSGDATVTRWIICDTPFMRGATGTDNMRFNTSGVSGSHAVTIPSKSGTMAVGTTAAAIADLVVGVATVDDCAAAINSILAVLRGFEQVSP